MAVIDPNWMDTFINTDALESIMRIFDVNEDGNISIAEVVDGINNKGINRIIIEFFANLGRTGTITDVTEEALMPYDNDNDGAFNIDEIHKLLLAYFAYFCNNVMPGPQVFRTYFTLIRRFNNEYGNGSQPQNNAAAAGPASASASAQAPKYEICNICQDDLNDQREVVKCPQCISWYHTEDAAEYIRSLQQQGQQIKCPICQADWPADMAGMIRRNGPVLEGAKSGGRRKKHSRKNRRKNMKYRKNQTLKYKRG